MKKIFIVLAMLMSCSLFAEVTQSTTYYNTFENPVCSDAPFKAEYHFTKNLQTGKTDSYITLKADGKNYESSFIYLLLNVHIETLNEIYNELNYAVNYVVPFIETEKRTPYYTELKTLKMRFTVRQSVYGLGDDSCFIPLDKVKPFSEMFMQICLKFYEHQKKFESTCLPVKPFSK